MPDPIASMDAMVIEVVEDLMNGIGYVVGA
jgi:hypothetical protein